jgi:hypothetical protein
MNIAIIGSRGIPGNYGGFETFAERLGLELVERGHNITIYCPSVSSSSDDKWYQGIRRVIIPTIKMKSLEKISSSFLACIHAVFTDYDIILFLGVAPALFAWLPSLQGRNS